MNIHELDLLLKPIAHYICEQFPIGFNAFAGGGVTIERITKCRKI